MLASSTSLWLGLDGGASKWVQNQPRAVANNIYEDGLDLPHDFLDHITFENFYKLGFCIEGPHAVSIHI
jgi:hypothetical protein